jgi:hypothetical protein
LKIFNADGDQPDLLWGAQTQTSVGEWLSSRVVTSMETVSRGLRRRRFESGLHRSSLAPGRRPAPLWVYSETTPGYVSKVQLGDIDSAASWKSSRWDGMSAASAC